MSVHRDRWLGFQITGIGVRILDRTWILERIVRFPDVSAGGPWPGPTDSVARPSGSNSLELVISVRVSAGVTGPAAGVNFGPSHSQLKL
jgi:hypothetical protein